MIGFSFQRLPPSKSEHQRSLIRASPGVPFLYPKIKRKVVRNLARGKKTPPETIFAIMTSWAVTDNPAETARQLNLPETTVRDIIEANKEKPEFVELREQKREEFSVKASRIIGKALDRLERDIDDEDKIIPVNHLTTTIGVLTEKKLLVEGKPTERTEVIGGETINKLAELAGYERKQ